MKAKKILTTCRPATSVIVIGPAVVLAGLDLFVINQPIAGLVEMVQYNSGYTATGITYYIRKRRDPSHVRSVLASRFANLADKMHITWQALVWS